MLVLSVAFATYPTVDKADVLTLSATFLSESTVDKADMLALSVAFATYLTVDKADMLTLSATFVQSPLLIKLICWHCLLLLQLISQLIKLIC